MDTSLNSQLMASTLAENEVESFPCTEDLTKQGDMSFLADSKEAEGFSGDEYSTKREKFQVVTTEDSHATCNEDQNILPNILDTSAVEKFSSVVNERGSDRSVVGISLELEDVKENYQKMTKERNSTQQKLFELQSEFCSVEIERDLEKETARYLEEQLSSLNSSLLFKENELVSLRKRYKLLNEGFLNSELLRDGLERDVSGMTVVIRELEQRLEVSEGILSDTKKTIEVKTGEVSVKCSCADEKSKLEYEILTINGTLEKERSAKTSLEEMFANVEKERGLLLKEVEELRSEHQTQANEVNVLRDLLHDKNKQDQMNLRQDQELQKRLQLKQQQQNEEASELRESKIQLSHKMSLLEDENKKLEGELYQQLAVLEKLEVENNSFPEAKKNLEEISNKLKIVGFHTVDQLAADYSVLQDGKLELETKITQLEHEISNCQISKEKMESHSGGGVFMTCPHLGVNCTKSSCIPRSEYLKQKFQLKSLTDELNSLKQTLRVLNEKFATSVTKQERRSRKHESKIAKKWLKTIKDSMNVVVKEDDIETDRCGAVLFENQLHETNLRIDELLHELEISKKEHGVLISTNRKREDEIVVLKRRLVESYETQNSLLREMKTKLQKAEKSHDEEIQKNNANVEKLVCLEEQNQDICIEFEKLKEKFQSLQKEKDKIKNELESLKRDILKNFGSQSIQHVSEFLTSAKEKFIEYVKIIDADKSNLVSLTQDLDSVQKVNTILREELVEVRIQLEKKDEIIAKKCLSEEISEKRQTERLQDVIQALENSKQNENELLAMYTDEKRECEKLQEELMSLHSELQETKMLLSEKEKECEKTNRIVRELEATCEVFEEEFEKSTMVHRDEDLPPEPNVNGLYSDENQEDELSESDSDSTAENFREMQEVLQERMAMKVKRLQNKLEETLAAVSSCQKLNVNLKEKLHETEKKIVEQEKVDDMKPDKEFLETILNKLAEKEKEIQEILQNHLSEPIANHKDQSENNVKETSRYKEVIRQLKIDHSKDEVRLVEAYEKITKLEEKLAMCQYYRDGNSNAAEMVVNVGVVLEEENVKDDSLVNNYENRIFSDPTPIVDCSNNFTRQSVNTTMTSSKTANEEEIAVNENLKEELDCMTAKYVNLKAAFDGCLRRLKISEVEENESEAQTVGIRTKFEKHESSNVIQKMVIPKFTEDFYSPLQGKKTETAEFYAGSQNLPKLENYQAPRGPKGSLFSEMSCAVVESDSELDSIGPDRMVIELTLTESDMDLLDGSETCEEYFQERLDFEKEFGRLRAKIIELEKINSRITGEIHRVKQCSFKERTDLENYRRSLQELNIIMKTKLEAVETENNSLVQRVNESDTRYLETKKEMQRLKISVLKEQQISTNTIKELKDQDNTMKKRVVTLETGKEELKMKIVELQRKLQDCSQETQRVKIESNAEGKNYKNIVSELGREIEVNKKEKERYALKISELNKQVCFLEDEIRKSKMCVQEEKLKREEFITKLEVVILNLEKENKDLEYKKGDTLLKNKELQDRNEILIKNREVNNASVLDEKKSLESIIFQLEKAITALENTLALEKMKNDDLACKSRKEHEESAVRSLNDRKTFEETLTQLREKIMILENEIKNLYFDKNCSMSAVKELEDRIDSLNEERQRSVKALLDENESFKNTTKELQITITNLRETCIVENIERDNTILLIQQENETLLLDERKQHEQGKKQFQDKISVLEKKINDIKLEKDVLETTIIRLENRLSLFSEENAQEKACWQDDKKKLETTIEQLQSATTTMEEKLKQEKLEKEISMTELQKTIFTTEIENQCFKIENVKLESQVLNCIDELQRVKSFSFDERQTKEADVKNLKETVVSMKMNITEDKQEINCLALVRNDFKTKCLFLQEELERVKKCSFQERKIWTDKIEQLTESLSSKEKTFDNIKIEKHDLVFKEKELSEIILSLQKELQRVKVCAFVERQILMAKDENYNTLVEESKTHFEYQILERESEISSLKLKVGELGDLRKILESDKMIQQEEISALRNAMENIQNAKKSLEKNVFNYEQQITTLGKDLSELQEVERSSTNEALQRDEELSSIKKVLDKLEDEKENLQNQILERDEKISLLQLNVSRFEQQSTALQTDMMQQAQETSDVQVVVENLEKKNKSFEDDILKYNSEMSLLQKNLSQLEEEREYLANGIGVKDEELFVIKLTVKKLQDERAAMEENYFNRDNEIFLLQTTLDELKTEKESIMNDLDKREKELSACKEMIENFEAQKKALEHDIVKHESEILLLKEKVCKLQEEHESFANDTIDKDEKLSAFEIAVEKFKSERKSFEEDIKKHGNEILLLESRLAKVQNEKESFMNDVVRKDEELSDFKITLEKLQHEKRALEENTVKQDSDKIILEANLATLENEKQTLAHDIGKVNKELSVFKITLEKLQHEKKVLEEDVSKQCRDRSFLQTNAVTLEKEKQKLVHEVVKKNEEVFQNKINIEKLQKENKFLEDSILKNDSDILILKDKISKHEEEKETSTNILVKQNGQFSTLQINVEELQNEKKAFEDEISKLNTGISSLESKVFNLQEEKEALTNDFREKDEQLSVFAKNIKKLEAVKEFLESKVADNKDEIISLRDNVDQLTKVKRSFEIDVQKQDEELLSVKATLHNLQGQNKVLENSKDELNDKLSHYIVKMERYQEEINLLRNDLRKATIEKESVQNMIREINEKTKCDEDDFDKLVAGYLQEIDSWKKKFGTLEEEMNVLKNETEGLHDEKRDLENIVKDMSESKRESEGNFHENIKTYHEEIDSWKVKVQAIERDAEILRKTVQELESECEGKKLEVEKTNKDKVMNSKLYQEAVTKFQKEKENSEKRWILEREQMRSIKIELETALQTMESQFETKQKELHGRNVSIEQFKAGANQLTKDISEKNEEISILGNKVLELEESKLEADNRIHEIQQQYGGKKSEFKELQTELQKETRNLTAIISEKEERICSLENEVKELTKLNNQQESENELRSLRDMLKSCEARELAAKEELNLMEVEVNRLCTEMSAVQRQKSEERNSENSTRSNIEKSREQLRVLLADINETSKIKISLEEEVRVLKSEVGQQSEEKTKLELDVFCLKEITDELTKGKLTLLEEIARLSDRKKEGQELLGSEFSRLRVMNKELQSENEKTQKENSEVIVQISSLKVTLATVQNAYEQTQDEIKNHKMRLEELIIRENQNNMEQDQLNEEAKKFKMKITYLEENNRSITIENKELSSSLNETVKRLQAVEKVFQTTKSENILLLERLKTHEGGIDDNLESGKPSTQVNNLRKKLKEFRTKLGEEKKQRELHEFEIKNLKEKVERLTKNEKEMEVQLESNRKKFLEVKTERDGLLMDLDSVNKRKKKDMEGYASRIETLEDELRILNGKESKKVDGKQMKGTVTVLNEEKRILELKFTSNQERHRREVTELKTTLDSLQSRYTTELKRFEATDKANQNEILKLKKSLTTVEGELESRERELQKLRANLVVVSNEKEKIEKVLSEKNSEVNKWKKEASNDKTEIKFLRGSLNILEKEGFASKPPETDERVPSE